MSTDRAMRWAFLLIEAGEPELAEKVAREGRKDA